MPTRSRTAPSDTAADVEDYSSLTLLQRLAKAREIVGGTVEKGGRNTVQDYNFVSQADVARKVGGALAAVGVAIIASYQQSEIKTYSNKSGGNMFLVSVIGTFRVMKAEDQIKNITVALPQGTVESFEFTTIGHGTDSGDKAPYKAMTGAFKYAMLHLLSLATGDDPENTVSEVVTSASLGNPVAPDAPVRRQSAESTTEVGGNPDEKVNTAQLRLIFGKSGEAGLSVDQFKALVYFTTGQRDTRRLTSGQVDQILAALADPQAVARAKEGGQEAHVKAADLLDEIRNRTGGEVVEAEHPDGPAPF